MNTDISILLEAWARWSRTGVLPQKASCLMGQLIISEREDFDIELSDDEAMKIDKAVLILKSENEKEYLAFFYHYICQFDSKRIAKKIGCSERHTYNLRNKAEERIEDIWEECK